MRNGHTISIVRILARTTILEVDGKIISYSAFRSMAKTDSRTADFLVVAGMEAHRYEVGLPTKVHRVALSL